MSGKKPSTVQGFIVVREFRGAPLYLASTHIGKGYRWLDDRSKAMVIADVQNAMAVSERASREYGAKAFVATTDEAPHIVERAPIQTVAKKYRDQASAQALKVQRVPILIGPNAGKLSDEVQP